MSIIIKQVKSDSSGFTLIEILIALFITSIMLSGSYAVFNSYQKNTMNQTAVSDIQQSLRTAAEYIARDIRMAGYSDPLKNLANQEFGISDIKSRNLNDNGDPNGNGFIRFSWDRNDNGVLNNDEVVEYGLVNGSTITPGVPDLYIRYPNNGNTRDVLSSNIIGLSFAYAYDSDGDGQIDRDGANNIIWAVDAGNDDDWDTLSIDQVAKTVTTSETATAIRHEDIRAVRFWLLGRSESPDQNYTDNNVYVVGDKTIQPNDNFRHRLIDRIVYSRNLGLTK